LLTKVSIKNFALIDSLEINFSKGFSIITGDTGSGKSILLNALSLIIGKRADHTLLKNDKIKCVIEAEFNLNSFKLKKIFDNNDLDYFDHSILRREVLPNGKSRSFVNDTPVNLDIMRSIGEQLVDIHSQNESLIAQWTEQQDNMSDFTDSANGTPHIYFGINRTIIEAANQTSGVFYNRVRIRYILHNKLENYGVHQADINGLQFSENGKGHSFQTGAGTKAHVYEDSYLVKMSFSAVAPTLEISDVEGDVASGSTTIDFGTIHS